MEKHVVEGTIPLFGYPLLCYNDSEREKDQDHPYLKALCSHVLRKNIRLSIFDIIDAQEKFQKKFEDL